MREIKKINEPEFWHTFKQRNTKLRYKDVSRLTEGKDLIARLRMYLLEEQRFLCAYCCREVDMTSSHNEHVKPESSYTNETMDYENIVASCNCIKTCGKAKRISMMNTNLSHQQCTDVMNYLNTLT